MKRYDRVVCVTCGEKTAWSAEHVAHLRTVAPYFPPFIVPNRCMRCLSADPAFKAEVEAWAKSQGGQWEQRVRSTLVRPLEAIDRFVEGLK